MPVQPPYRLHVEVLVAGLDFPCDAPSSGAVDQESAVSAYPVGEVARGSIEDGELYRSPCPFFDAGGEVQAEALECVRRIRFEQERDIDIAVEALSAAGDGPVQVGGDDVRLGVEFGPQRRGDRFGFGCGGWHRGCGRLRIPLQPTSDGKPRSRTSPSCRTLAPTRRAMCSVPGRPLLRDAVAAATGIP